MSATPFSYFPTGAEADLAVILGTNETASAMAVKLRKAGYRVILSHEPCPPVLRRGMAFADALFDDPITLEGISGRRADFGVELTAVTTAADCVAVTPLQLCDLLALRRIQLLIDARLKPGQAKPDYRRYVGLSVGLGPHFSVDENCDLVIDASPTHCEAIAHCIQPQPCDIRVAVRDPAVATAPAGGVWHTSLEIGAPARHGDLIGKIGGASVRAPRNGVILGLARDGLTLQEGAPVIEIDPDRKGARDCRGLDPRAELIAEQALAAIHRAAGAPRPASGAA